nr:hypothetical protein [Patescibacteria group bacterium]
MVSPFYLGRNPEDEAGGRYPGKPISGGDNRFTAPPEFVNLTDDFDAMWDKAAGGLATATVGLPTLYLEEQKKAWKALFQISGGFESYVEDDPEDRRRSGDEEQFYKASDFKIDLIQIFTDPQAQLKDIFSATYNTADLRKEGKDRLMKAMLFGQGAAQSGPIAGKLLDTTLSGYKERFDSMLLRSGVGGNAPHDLNLYAPDPQRASVQALYQGNAQPTPDQLNQASVIYHKDFKDTIATKSNTPGATKKLVRTDSRVAFGQAYLKYSRVEDTEKNTAAFRTLVNQAGVSMKDIFADASLPNATSPDALIHATALKYATPGTAQYTQIVAQLQDALDRFNSMSSLSESLGKMYAPPFGGGFLAGNKLSALDTTRFAPGIPGIPTDFGTLASSKEIKDAREALISMGTSVQGVAKQVDAVKTAYANNVYVSAAEKARVAKWVAKMDKELSALSGGADLLSPTTNLGQTWASILTPASGTVLTSRQIAERRALTARLNSFKSKVSGYDVFNTGLHTDLVKIYVDHHILPTRGIDPLNSASTIAGHTLFGKQIQMYTLGARDSYKLNYYDNLYTKIRKGQVTSTYFKSRFINSLPNYTPQNIAKRFLGANHYWGLKIDEYTYADYEKWLALGSPAGDFSGFYKGGNAFVHKLSNSKSFGFLLQNRFTIDLGMGLSPVSAIGGSHFNVVKQLNIFRKMSDHDISTFLHHQVVQNQQLTPGGIGAIAGLSALMQQGMSEKNAFILLLLSTNSETNFNNLFGHLPFGSDADKIFNQLQEFKNWLRAKHFDVFDAAGNFDVTKFSNLDLLLEWFHKRKINPSYIDVTRKTVGLVEKLTQRLNILQDKVYNFEKWGFKFGKVFFWQQQATSIVYNKLLTILNKVIAKFSSKLVVGAAGAATGGLALLLAPLLEKLIYYISTSIIGRFSRSLSSMLKGDFSSLGKAIEGSVQLLVKVIAYTCLAVALLLLFPFLFMQFITSNMTPKAPYAYNNTQATTPITLIEGDDVVPGACPSGSLTNGALSTWNPSYSGRENAGHGSNHYWN